MNFKIFKAARPKKIVGKSIYRKTHSISSVISTSRIEDLEELVLRNFEDILNYSDYDEYHYFTMYKSWRTLFVKHSVEVLDDLKTCGDCFCAFEEIIENFPELESEVYNFLLKSCLDGSINEYLRNQINIPDDILYPMLYLERYSNIKFALMHEKIIEIIDEATTYSEFFAIISFYKNELEVPADIIDPIVTKFISDDVARWTAGEASIEDFPAITELFQSREAYELFMENLCEIFSIYGLSLYAYLVKHVGPIHEIIARERCCYEFCDR